MYMVRRFPSMLITCTPTLLVLHRGMHMSAHAVVDLGDPLSLTYVHMKLAAINHFYGVCS